MGVAGVDSRDGIRRIDRVNRINTADRFFRGGQHVGRDGHSNRFEQAGQKGHGNGMGWEESGVRMRREDGRAGQTGQDKAAVPEEETRKPKEQIKRG